MLNFEREQLVFSCTDAIHQARGVVGVLPNLTTSTQRYYITDIAIANSTSTAALVRFWSNGIAKLHGTAPASNNYNLPLHAPLKLDPAQGMSVEVPSATAQAYVTFSGFIGA